MFFLGQAIYCNVLCTQDFTVNTTVPWCLDLEFVSQRFTPCARAPTRCARAQLRRWFLLQYFVPFPYFTFLPLSSWLDWILQALTTTFDLLEASRTLGDAASSECGTAILLLSDGGITEGLGVEDPSEISTLVETLNADIGAEIFTFALGPEADSVSKSNLDLRIGDGSFYSRPLFEQGNVASIPRET